MNKARLLGMAGKLRPRDGVFGLVLLLLGGAIAPSPAQIASPASGAGSLATVLGPAERAEENFPGSAFYFLDPNFAIPVNYDGAESMGISRTGGLVEDAFPFIGPSARPFPARGSALDKARAQKCLTDAVYYEAGLEPDAGQRAVAQVILNRVAHPSYPNTVCGVIYQGSERASGCQFTYSCDGSMRRSPSRYHWRRAARVASQALAGQVYAPAGLATHYHTTEVRPYWAASLDFLGTIGAHRFYRWKGAAGRPEAFLARYAGGEPVPGPKARSSVPVAAEALALARRYERAQANAAAAPDAAKPDHSEQPPEDSGGRLPPASQIKPEYAASGSWKKGAGARPGG